MAPGLFSVFSGRQPPVTMATIVPPRPAKRGIEGVTVGLLHPTGSKAVARLAEAGVAIPRGLAAAPGPRPPWSGLAVAPRHARHRHHRLGHPGRYGVVPDGHDGGVAGGGLSPLIPWP